MQEKLSFGSFFSKHFFVNLKFCVCTFLSLNSARFIFLYHILSMILKYQMQACKCSTCKLFFSFLNLGYVKRGKTWGSE